MNAPDKIYLERDKETEKIDFRWGDRPVVHSAYEHIEYIRKDVSNEAIQVAEDHAFLAGADWQKAQMMKEAVEGEVENASLGIVYLRKNLMNEGHSTGDKVRIIIVKGD